jgi:hypothetical protein
MDIVIKNIFTKIRQGPQTHAHYIQATRTLKYPQIGVPVRRDMVPRLLPCDELLQKPVGEVIKMVVPEPIDG